VSESFAPPLPKNAVAVANNLEARLLVLRKRLAALERGITLDRVDRGRLSLSTSAPLTLVEVPTTGPMRAAHHPLAGG
jgi:hypothetical protein